MFVNAVVAWDGVCKIVYGRPRHPQSQGLVEQANGTIEKMITAMMATHNTKDWVQLLPIIMWNLNTSRSSSTHFMPYEVTFNKKPNVGSLKQFTEINERDVETPVEEMAVEEAAVAVSGVLEEIAEEEIFEDEIPLSALVPRQLQQNEADEKRETLNLNKVLNGEKLIKKHDHKRNKKTRSFKIGHKVTVKIPRIDRAGTGFPRLPGLSLRLWRGNVQNYN